MHLYVGVHRLAGAFVGSKLPHSQNSFYNPTVEIHIGTSGWSYPEWIGPFYPRGTGRAKLLEAYSAVFDAAEVNSTYYRLPGAKTVEGWVEKTGGRMIFAVKLPKELTHAGSPVAGSADAGWEVDAAVERAAEAVRQCVAPLADAGALGCLLAQFPSSFHRNRENSRYLGWLRGALKEFPLVVEFRNDEWIRPEILKWLADTGTGFACVDQPRLAGLAPPFFLATGETGYVRMHGRNSANWWTGDNVTRYEYDYSDAELNEWADVVRRAIQNFGGGTSQSRKEADSSETSASAIPLDADAEVFLKERKVFDWDRTLGVESSMTEARAMLKKIFFFYNNHSHAYAAKNALRFREMMMEESR